MAVVPICQRVSSVFTFEEGSIDKLLDASGPLTQAWATPYPSHPQLTA